MRIERTTKGDFEIVQGTATWGPFPTYAAALEALSERHAAQVKGMNNGVTTAVVTHAPNPHCDPIIGHAFLGKNGQVLAVVGIDGVLEALEGDVVFHDSNLPNSPPSVCSIVDWMRWVQMFAVRDITVEWSLPLHSVEPAKPRAEFPMLEVKPGLLKLADDLEAKEAATVGTAVPGSVTAPPEIDVSVERVNGHEFINDGTGRPGFLKCRLCGTQSLGAMIEWCTVPSVLRPYRGPEYTVQSWTVRFWVVGRPPVEITEDDARAMLLGHLKDATPEQVAATVVKL